MGPKGKIKDQKGPYGRARRAYRTLIDHRGTYGNLVEHIWDLSGPYGTLGDYKGT